MSDNDQLPYRRSQELERYSLLIDIALLMAQELQDMVDEAVESASDEDALPTVQALLRDWEQAYSGKMI